MTVLQLSAAEVSLHLRKIELAARRLGSQGGAADEIVRFGSFVGSTVDCYSNLDRAMEYGRRHIDTEEREGRSVKSGKIIVAEQLSGSKGRFTRRWHAPVGGLWGCLLHANTLLPQSTMLLSFAVGIAACEVLREFGANSSFLRWVNDVLIRGNKVAGFLIEGHTGPRWKEQYHLIGFGINVNNTTFPKELKGMSTSLAKEVHEKIDLKDFCLSFISKLAWNIGLLYYHEAKNPDWYHESKTDHPVIARWKELSNSLGRRVIFGYDVVLKPQYSAYIKGLTRDGGLQMVLDDGLDIVEHSGEIRYL